MLWLLLFGTLVLFVFALIYVLHRFWRRTAFNITFSRLYGLLVVAILAVALAFAELSGETQTAAYTLLGTIAGYLAGAKPTPAVGVPPAPPAEGDLDGAEPDNDGAVPTRWEEPVL